MCLREAGGRKGRHRKTDPQRRRSQRPPRHRLPSLCSSTCTSSRCRSPANCCERRRSSLPTDRRLTSRFWGQSLGAVVAVRGKYDLGPRYFRTPHQPRPVFYGMSVPRQHVVHVGRGFETVGKDAVRGRPDVGRRDGASRSSRSQSLSSASPPLYRCCKYNGSSAAAPSMVNASCIEAGTVVGGGGLRLGGARPQQLEPHPRAGKRAPQDGDAGAGSRGVGIVNAATTVHTCRPSRKRARIRAGRRRRARTRGRARNRRLQLWLPHLVRQIARYWGEPGLQAVGAAALACQQKHAGQQDEHNWPPTAPARLHRRA